MKVKITISTNKVGSECSDVVDFPDWEEMTEKEREDDCFQIAMQMASWDYQTVEDDGK